MASFSTPYTNWGEHSYFSHTDYNRIKNNIQYLIDLSFELFPEYEYEDMGNDKTYSDFPYADEFNLIELNLKLLHDKSFGFVKYTSSDMKNWYPNKPTPSYEDMNRYEQMTVDYYNGLNSIKKNKNKLGDIKLGMKL